MREDQPALPGRIVSLDAKTDPATKPFKTVVARLVKASAAKSIAAGGIARWKFPKAQVKKGIVHTHACDDLAAVAAALAAFDGISRDASLAHVALLFTRSLRFLDHCLKLSGNLGSGYLGSSLFRRGLLRLGLLFSCWLSYSRIEIAHLAHDWRFYSGRSRANELTKFLELCKDILALHTEFFC